MFEALILVSCLSVFARFHWMANQIQGISNATLVMQRELR